MPIMSLWRALRGAKSLRFGPMAGSCEGIGWRGDYFELSVTLRSPDSRPIINPRRWQNCDLGRSQPAGRLCLPKARTRSGSGPGNRVLGHRSAPAMRRSANICGLQADSVR